MPSLDSGWQAGGVSNVGAGSWADDVRWQIVGGEKTLMPDLAVGLIRVRDAACNPRDWDTGFGNRYDRRY